MYGDDVGLSAARARRAMDTVKQDPLLASARSEHEGRGYVQSDDVVNAGFIQGDESFVRVQVVYDERVPLDDYEGVDITPITREISPKSPYELNVMRITVDGKPIDDPNRSSSDVQRCTDVALDEAKIRFRFDNLESRPRLGVAAHPRWPWRPSASRVRFQMYNNYASFIERAEIRIFDAAAVARGTRRSRSSRSTRRAWPSGSRPWKLSRARCASSSSCCAPMTRRATSTKRKRGRCGSTASRRPQQARRPTRPHRRPSCWPPTARATWSATAFRSAAAR